MKQYLGYKVITLNEINKKIKKTEVTLKWKKVSKGFYETKYRNISIDIYNTGNKYWSSTITVGEYGDVGWEEVSIQNTTKKDLIKDIKSYIISLKGNTLKTALKG